MEQGMYEKSNRKCMRKGIRHVWEKESELYGKMEQELYEKWNRDCMRKGTGNV